MAEEPDDARYDGDPSDDEQSATLEAGQLDQRRLQNKVFEGWVRKMALGDGFVQQRNADRLENQDDESMTIRSLMARQESAEIIKSPRDYQLELYERAKKERLIAVLDTGTGKTLIAVLLIRWFMDQEAEARHSGKHPRVALFLVPSVNLVLQQTAVLESNLAYSIGSFYGALNVDIWSKDDWNKIVTDHRVIVCTADILLGCLGRSFINMRDINLLVFDEAHHAKKNNPYARIMDYYRLEKDAACRPHVFGMTASPVDAKTDIAQAATWLERLLDSRIITTGDLTSLQSLRRPEEINMYYHRSSTTWNTVLAQDMARRLSDLPYLKEHFDSACLVAHHLGGWCADQHMLEVLCDRAKGKLNMCIEKTYSERLQPEDVAHLDQERARYHEALSHLEHNHSTIDAQPTQDLWTDKVSVLKKVLDAEFEEVTQNRCMVFVERQVTAQLLARLFERIGHHNLRCGYLIGGAGKFSLTASTQTFKDQVLTLTRFRKGDINCLFVTSVAEEGLDVPLCNLVVRFDLYRSMIQYVQSRGRARQNDSKFIHMIDINSPDQQRQRQEVLTQEIQMRNWCSALSGNRQLLSDVNLCKDEQNESTFVDDTTGARLTFDNALAWLGQAVAVMPRDISEPSYPTYLTNAVGAFFKVEVMLPAGAPVRSTTGKVCRSKLLARQSAAFKMCRQLRDVGFLDAHFMPTYLKKLPLMRNALLAVDTKGSTSYDMMTKPEIWKQGRGQPSDKLYMVVVDFPDGFEHVHQSLVMLTRMSMPEFPPFVIVRNDGQHSRVESRTIVQSITVDETELQLLATFTLRVFKDVFSKTYEETIDELSYFLAPAVQSLLVCSKYDLDWPLLQRVATKDCDSWTPDTTTEMLVHKVFVDRWDGARKLITHSIHPTLRPQDPVPADAAKQKWNANILDYSVSLFKKSRASAQWVADQPVIVAEKLDLRRNMLIPASTKELSLRTKTYICPEPFRISMLPVPLVVSSLAWPSVVWRFESVLIAVEACSFLGIDCKPELALAAITKDTKDSPDENAALELHRGMGENYERLEFLGDCFLKLATTLAVFVQKPHENEFVSHVERMLMLCNKTLFKTSLAMGLPKYIRSKPMSRRLWYPEGLHLIGGKGVNEEQNSYNTQKQGLSEKTIADVSEALIGAAYLSHDQPDNWQADHWEDAVKAVTKLVGQEMHSMQKWSDYVDAYKIPEYQSSPPTASQRESAAMLEKAHDYHFNYPTLLRSAMTHGSQPFTWENLPSYERLEFLGDALLDMAIITHLFYRFPEKDEQWLTEAKTAMVSNRFFGALACKLGLHKHIRHNSSPTEIAIRAYTTELHDKLQESGDTRDYWLHVSSPPKCLADLVEAYVGAMFIDSGFDYGQVQRFFDIHIKWHFEDMRLYSGYVSGHPVTKLHQMIADYGCRMMRILNTPLPAITRGDRKEIVIAVMIHDKVVAHTTGASVRYGNVRAAKSAFRLIDGLTREEFATKYHCNCDMHNERREEQTNMHMGFVDT